MLLRYGDHPSQYGLLTLPATPGPWPVAVVLHGGFWRTRHGVELAEPLAAELAAIGVAAWSLEYRRVGDDPMAGGGGWPHTCLDVSAGVDLLAGAGQSAADGSLDLSRVVAIGHSAGGHLAGWLAARPTLPPGAPGAGPVVSLTGFVSQAGVLDLADAEAQDLGGGAVLGLMGAMSAASPVDFALASPIERVPLGVPAVCVHGTADDVVPIRQSERFVASAELAGDSARLIAVPGADHISPIDVASQTWATCRAAVADLLG